MTYYELLSFLSGVIYAEGHIKIKRRGKNIFFDTLEIEDFLREKIISLFSPSEEIEYNQTYDQEIEIPSRSRRLRIGNEIFEIRTSREILIKTAEWLIRKGKLKASDCPISAGYKRYLINTEPKHRYGENFRSPKRLSNGLYIETHYSTASCINLARKLLEKFGYNKDLLKVE